MTEDWRISTNGADYLRNQQKRVAIEQRRPVIRKASDLVGPGIGASATVITDYNDVLATFNGYYSSAPGAALYAPNTSDSFIGSVIMDETLGGVQTFTSLETGVEYTRTFLRNPSDENSVSFGLWHSVETIPATATSPVVGNAQVITPLSNDEETVVTMPLLDFVGDQFTYARSERTLTILRPGVYSGYYWLRTTEDIVLNYLITEFPNWEAQTYDVLYNPYGGGGLRVPLHFVTTSTEGFLRLKTYQNLGTTQHVEFNRLHLTRLGDAV